MALVRTRLYRADPIGRERETVQLAAARRAASEGRGGILLVGGDAGIGKSRLLQHFATTVASGRAMLATSRCVEFVQTPLSPLRELLSQLERRESAGHDAMTKSLIERLAFAHGADPAAAIPPSGSLFDSIDAAFARFAVRGTAVLLVEDIHWADRSTLAFLTYLADRIAKRRMLVVASYRSDEVGSQHPRLSEFAALLSKNAVTTLALSPLDERATQALVEQALTPGEALSSGTLADIVRRSQGNAFFAEELVKNALEAHNASPAHALPLSIRGAVLARAAQLSDADRSIVSLAAVLGERFSIDQLVSLLHGDREAVLRALESARRLSLLHEEPGIPGRLSFRHALTQEVLYGELLGERVRPLHEAIALELERGAERTAVSVELAHHWRRAGNAERAAVYDELSGDHAAGIGAYADAVLYYERALAAHAGPSAELTHKLGVALGALSHLAAGIERLRVAADLYWQTGDYEGFARNASALGAQLYNSGNAEAATMVYRDALNALGSKLPSNAVTLLRARISYNCVAALDFDSASAFVDELPEAIDDPFVATNAYQTRFKVAAMRGEVDRWRINARATVEAARRVTDAGAMLRHAHTQVALDALALGEVEYAREHFSAATAAQQADNPLGLLVSAASALEHTLRGDFAAAAGLLKTARSVPEQAYAIQVHVKSAHFVLGICSGDDALLRADDSEPFLRYGVNHGMKLAIGLLGGPYAWALGLRGELDEAAAWISQIADVLPGPHRFMFAYLAAAQYGRAEDALRMRVQLAEAAARPQDRANKAVLALFDAFASERGIVKEEVRRSALEAATLYDAIGWPWFAARGYELGGESRRAAEAFRSLGSLRDLRRLEGARSDASTSVLSSREQEVAQLVASGHSNEEIAQILHISSRTAEKHVSSALRKLNLRSRLQLGQVLARSQTGVG